MNFCFYSARTFESWDWNTPLETGIGGSETSHVEMAQRLARRGHFVVNWAPTNQRVSYDDHGELWMDSAEVHFEEFHGVIVAYREPAIADKLDGSQPAWLICQDVSYRSLTPDRAAKFTRIVALCEDHANHLKAIYPYAADKVCVSSNGIRSELIQNRMGMLSHETSSRNPKRLIYASSPDRGLFTLLHVFGRLRELVPDVELHVYYGFNNLDKIEKNEQYHGEIPPQAATWAKRVERNNQILKEALKAPGIVHHGRIGQRAMVDEWLQAGIWCHPSEFTETSCITCMDAQACGAIPVTTPIWAVGENVRYGVMVEGNPESDPLTRSRYVHELLNLVQDRERQAAIRAEMMPWALGHFDWENFVTQWEGWAAEDLARVRREAAA